LIKSTKAELQLAPEIRVDVDSTRSFALTLLNIRPCEETAARSRVLSRRRPRPG